MGPVLVAHNGALVMFTVKVMLVISSDLQVGGMKSGGGLRKKVSNPANVEVLKNGLRDIHEITLPTVLPAAVEKFEKLCVELGETTFYTHLAAEYLVPGACVCNFCFCFCTYYSVAY